MTKKIFFLVITIIIMLIIIHESYHIALILIYGYPANLFSLFLILIYLFFQKNEKLQKFFPQIKNNFLSIIYSFLIISIIAPFIILYAKNFSYDSVLLFELSIINIRDKIMSITNLSFSYLFIIFFILLFLSFLLNKNLSTFYEKTQNTINHLMLVLFSITSFSLTSSYFIDKKTKEIYDDINNNIKIIEQKINNKKKFILTCNILKDTFRNHLFKKDILNKIITSESIKNPKKNAMNFSYYLAYYFNNNYTKETNIKEKNIKSNNITYSKIKKILSDYEKKTYELLTISKQQNIVKNNTINLLTDILTKVININQNNLLKVFINTLINDLNNKISTVIIEHFDYKTNIFSYIEEKEYFKYLKKYNKNIINKLHNDFEFKFKLPNMPKIKIKNRLRWFKHLRL